MQSSIEVESEMGSQVLCLNNHVSYYLVWFCRDFTAGSFAIIHRSQSGISKSKFHMCYSYCLFLACQLGLYSCCSCLSMHRNHIWPMLTDTDCLCPHVRSIWPLSILEFCVCPALQINDVVHSFIGTPPSLERSNYLKYTHGHLAVVHVTSLSVVKFVWECWTLRARLATDNCLLFLLRHCHVGRATCHSVTRCSCLCLIEDLIQCFFGMCHCHLATEVPVYHLSVILFSVFP